jgi:hypothetical protein
MNKGVPPRAPIKREDDEEEKRTTSGHKIPATPHVPTIDAVGFIPSYPPKNPIDDHESRISMLESGFTALSAQVNANEKHVAGMIPAIEAQIKETVKTSVTETTANEFATVNTTLSHQNGEMIRQGGLLSEVLTIVSDQQKAAQKRLRASLHDARKEQDVFDGKARQIRLNARTAIYILLGLVALGGAAGLSHCKHAPSVESFFEK